MAFSPSHTRVDFSYRAPYYVQGRGNRGRDAAMEAGRAGPASQGGNDNWFGNTSDFVMVYASRYLLPFVEGHHMSLSLCVYVF